MKVAGMKGWRTLYYLPSLISGVVIAMLRRGLFDDQYGIINYIIRQFGGSAPKWLLDPKYTLYCFLFLSVWSCGGSMIIYLSGLQGIPTELYEAAVLQATHRHTDRDEYSYQYNPEQNPLPAELLHLLYEMNLRYFLLPVHK